MSMNIDVGQSYIAVIVTNETVEEINCIKAAIDRLNNVYDDVNHEIRPLINKIDHNFVNNPLNILSDVTKLKVELTRYISDILANNIALGLDFNENEEKQD